ncbi:hypothetical protein C8A01DRAFT_39920 [Parachaetomium inaequale]|uniref:F-box domain-containing protein n=1 Tax=Parachaetomium inaequale TaxID=2588326 RepID=A0AAN6PA53_9PEZI|nr:hypothetical protein C8A01DRAFT_39920 [Parachaetomium inaequale]
MGRLPNEIIANIISYLAADIESSSPFTLAPYATVSRAWQQRVEAATFAHIELTPARLASPLAAEALTPDRVRRFVRSVRVDVLLPPYDEQARGRREDEADRARNDGVFTDVVRRVFGLLAAATAPASESPAAIGGDGGCVAGDEGHDLEDLEAREYERCVSPIRVNDIFEARYESSYLDHSFQTPSILDETDRDNNDKLSLALCKLSQRLATFDLMADVGPEILWPLERTAPDHHHQQQHQDNDPLWPTMCHYTINPGPIAPSGKWRFQRLPDSDSDSDDDGSASSVSSSVAPGNEKEDPFRAMLDPDAARALLLAAARAARRMPALRKMEFMLDPPIWRDNGRLEVVYTAMAGTARGGTPLAPPGGGGATAELLVESRPVFHPDEEVVQAWREAAEEHSGIVSGLVVVVREHMAW